MQVRVPCPQEDELTPTHVGAQPTPQSPDPVTMVVPRIARPANSVLSRVMYAAESESSKSCDYTETTPSWEHHGQG